MDNTAAHAYLSSLLNAQLRVHTTDDRVFAGEFKCTDNESNIILSRAYEYRAPSAQDAMASASSAAEASGTVRANMTSRFMGLVVVPGQHIVKIEVEGAVIAT